MLIVLYDSYWSSKKHIGIKADTPLEDAKTELFIYEEISDEMFNNLLTKAKAKKESYTVNTIDDGRNKTYEIYEKYVKRNPNT